VQAQVLAEQREDGGWRPFWAADYSSLDATCFRLAQAVQVGITAADPAVQRALAMLAARQRLDGSWEEDAELADRTPRWVAPGVLEARLYLSANCGFWLAVWTDASPHATRAANYVRTFVDPDGTLPSLPHALWLSGGLWYRVQYQEDAERAFSALARLLADLPASNLVWLLSTLLLAQVRPDHPLLEEAARRLEQLQEPDGRWTSVDGPSRDVYTTVEALRVLNLCRHS
jgi:hypothetical protein